MKIFLYVCFAAAVLRSNATACFSTPAEQIVSPETLFVRTKQIVLAHVVKAVADLKSGNVTYSFVVDQAVKGENPKAFTIVGGSLSYPEDLTTFDHHRSERFWKEDAGRCQHDTDCVIHPAFAVGDTYLIFVDSPYHRKSFERIAMLGKEAATRDRWLAWVENKVKAQQIAP